MGSRLESIGKMLLLVILLVLQLAQSTLVTENCSENVELNKNRQCKIQDATSASGYTNFKIRLRKKNKRIKDISRQHNAVSDVSVSGGPYRSEPWREVNIPMPLLLNERIRNPKFISKNPKRTNRRKQKTKVKNVDRKKKKSSSAIHANILNTNFKFAFLARKKQVNTENSLNSLTKVAQNPSENINLRIGLKNRRKTRVLRRKKLKQNSRK